MFSIRDVQLRSRKQPSLQAPDQLNHDRRICVFFVVMKWMFQEPSLIT